VWCLIVAIARQSEKIAKVILDESGLVVFEQKLSVGSPASEVDDFTW